MIISAISPMIRNLFTDSLATISDAKYFILIAFIIYLCASITGWLYPENFPFLNEQAEELVSKFTGKNAITFISKLLIQNLIAAYVTTCIISLWGFFPALAAISNGLLLGWAITNVPTSYYSKVIILLIPHGVFEWPAMSIGWGIGMWKGLGYRFSSIRPTYKERFKKANIVYFTVILPLLLVAAIIEGRYHIYRDFLS
jgi:stage II sporulation protein M